MTFVANCLFSKVPASKISSRFAELSLNHGMKRLDKTTCEIVGVHINKMPETKPCDQKLPELENAMNNLKFRKSEFLGYRNFEACESDKGNWFYFDELEKQCTFTKEEAALSFKDYCIKHELPWQPNFHTDPKRAAAFHEYDLEIVAKNDVSVDEKTTFRREDPILSLAKCAISNGPYRPWFRMCLEYYDSKNKLMDAKDLMEYHTDKRLVPESEFFWLPENLNISIKDYRLVF